MSRRTTYKRMLAGSGDATVAGADADIMAREVGGDVKDFLGMMVVAEVKSDRDSRQ
jgi:hypothetical protein